jgi:preprotein translocase subunit SecG
MSNDDTEENIKKGNGQSTNKDHDSIFQIMDGIMSELNKTRKVFVFMFFSMMILPVTAIIIFMYTFDESKISHDELRSNIQEFNTLSQKMKNQMLTIENLPTEEQEKALQSMVNSEEYKQSINKITELSQNELKLISSEHKNYLYKKEIRLITFILSIIWIILGIRQYIILSNWGKRYTKFKKQQEEIDKKLDSA